MRGSIKCLNFMHCQGWKFSNEALPLAASKGHLQCVKFLHEVCRKKYTPQVMMQAAHSSQLDIFRYLHETNCLWDAEVCATFASKDLLECLTYAHQNGCPWDVRTCIAAAKGGHLRCLEYAHLQGCVWDVRFLILAGKLSDS